MTGKFSLFTQQQIDTQLSFRAGEGLGGNRKGNGYLPIRNKQLWELPLPLPLPLPKFNA